MSKQKDTLVVNGKIFDVTAGRSAGISSNYVKNLDGFFKPSHTSTRRPHHHAAASGLTASHKRQQPAATAVHHRREHAKTLMRSAVTKPQPVKLAALSSRLEPSSSAVRIISAPLLHVQERHSRAKQTTKSRLISRFGTDLVEPQIDKKTLPLQVKRHPDEPVNKYAHSAISDSLTNRLTETASDTSDIFTAALSRATSHEQPAPSVASHRKSKRSGIRRRAANVLVSTAVVLVLGSFIAYQNMASINLHMAATKAGVQASLPTYRPAGFALSRHIQTSPGQIVISFHSNSDNRNFSITQKASDWNSQTLLDNFVALHDSHYQRLSQSNGKTIFVYGDANATWVDGGVWYNIVGNSSLSNEQLLKLANSL